jgi:hypothetical protein
MGRSSTVPMQKRRIFHAPLLQHQLYLRLSAQICGEISPQSAATNRR